MRGPVAIITLACALIMPVQGAVQVNVAMWTGPGADQGCVQASYQAVEEWNSSPYSQAYVINLIGVDSSSEWESILETGKDPITGQKINVVYVPGGYHPEWHWDFDWEDALYHAQLDLKMGYVGICAGAYVHEGITEPGNLSEDNIIDGVEVVDGDKGSGDVQVYLFPNPITPSWTWNHIWTYHYANGPGFGPEPQDVIVSPTYWYRYATIEGKEVLIKVWPFGKYVNTVSGWAMVLGQYYVKSGDEWVPCGRFALFGVHPELTDRMGAHVMFCRALIWAAGYNPFSSAGASENEGSEIQNQSTTNEIVVIEPSPTPSSQSTGNGGGSGSVLPLPALPLPPLPIQRRS